jgi:TrmH family RNA methyltransferase
VLAARRLRRRPSRDREGAFLVEGVIGVAGALSLGADVSAVFVAEDSAHVDEMARLAAERRVPFFRASRRVIEALSDAATPQGVVAVAAAPGTKLEDLPRGISLVLVLADVRDPGNAGTLLRSALAAGAGAVVFCSGAVDPLNPKTVRASAGSLFHIPVVRGSTMEEATSVLKERGLRLVGADTSGTPAYETDLRAPVALVLGNEAWGLDPRHAGALDDWVSIPMPGPAESLNVGIAGSILLFEAARQRRSEHPAR